MDLKYERRKSSQIRQGNNVLMSAIPHGDVCPARHLREDHKCVGSYPASFVFRGFNGRLVAKSPRKTQPYDAPIKYEQVLRLLSLWFSGVLGSSPTEFRKLSGTQSGCSGGSLVASNAGILLELWGQNGLWNSFAS